MTDRGLLEGIGSLHELTLLRLDGGSDLTAQALSTFLHRPSMTSIVLLDLSFCSNLDDEGLQGIAERCNKLTCLNVVVCLEHAVQVSVYDCEVSLSLCLCLQMHTFERFGYH